MRWSNRLWNRTFDSKTDCFFCGTYVVLKQRNYGGFKHKNAQILHVFCIIAKKKKNDEGACSYKCSFENSGIDLHAVSIIFGINFRKACTYQFSFKKKKMLLMLDEENIEDQKMMTRNTYLRKRVHLLKPSAVNFQTI